MTDETTAAAADTTAADTAHDVHAALTIEHAASLAGCTVAYLAECIACGQVGRLTDGRLDADSIITWTRQSLRPQQVALRAVVDAIDVMEQRSLKPAASGEAEGADPSIAAVASRPG